jgi:hypothetical protein
MTRWSVSRLILTLLAVSAIYGGIQGIFGGLETASMVFIFVVGLNSFKSPFRMLIQSGLSRKTYFISAVSGIFILALAMSAIDSVNALAGEKLWVYQSTYFQFYGQRYLRWGTFIQYLDGFFWSVSAYSWIAMTGLLITAMYYRMDKTLKLLVSVGVPVLVFIVLPIVEATFTHGLISRSVSRFFSYAFGFANGTNPYYSVVSCLIFSAVTGWLTYLLIRRAPVKE